MKIPVTVLLILCSARSFAQQGTWEGTKDWKLYKIQGNKAFRLKQDSLLYIESVPLNEDSLKTFLNSSGAWPKEKYSLWMGSYLASFADSAGLLHKVDISMYGGFFFDERTKTYFQVAADMKNDWLQFMSRSYEKLASP